MSDDPPAVSWPCPFALASLVLRRRGCSEELGPERMIVARVKGVCHKWTFTGAGGLDRVCSGRWDGRQRCARPEFTRDGSFEAARVAVGINLIRLANAPLGSVGAERLFSSYHSPDSPRHPRPASRADRGRPRRTRPSVPSSMHRLAPVSQSPATGDSAMSDDSPAPAPQSSFAESDRRTANRPFISAIATAPALFHADWPIAQVEEAIDDQAGLLWIDIQGPDEHTGTISKTGSATIFTFITWPSKTRSSKRTFPGSTTGATTSTSSFTSRGSIPKPKCSSCKSSTSSWARIT